MPPNEAPRSSIFTLAFAQSSRSLRVPLKLPFQLPRGVLCVAGAKKASRHEAIEQWPEHWSADSHYGDSGFRKGPVRSRGAGVRKIIVIYLVDSCDASDSNGDDPGRPSC